MNSDEAKGRALFSVEDFNLLKIERVQNEGGRMVARTVDDAVLTKEEQR